MPGNPNNNGRFPGTGPPPPVGGGSNWGGTHPNHADGRVHYGGMPNTPYQPHHPMMPPGGHGMNRMDPMNPAMRISPNVMNPQFPTPHHLPAPSLGQSSNQMTSNYTWQNPERDAEIRKQMISRVINLLRERKPDAQPDWINKLPEMAKKLEDRLYMYSISQETYHDPSTLTQRLQRIAMEITNIRQREREQTRIGAQGDNGSRGVVFHPGHHPPTPSPHPHHPSNPQTQTPTTSHVMGNRSLSRASNGNLGNAMPMNPSPSNSQQHMINQRTTPQNQPGHGYNHGMVGQGMQPQGERNRMQTQTPTRPSGEASTQQQQRQRQVVLRQQQQRLLLLRHASRCPYTEGTCAATGHCAQYKKLWLHIASCRDQQCDTPHCVSSRYVLSHYHRCQEKSCAVCGPVRDAIEKHNRLKLKQKIPNNQVEGLGGHGATQQPMLNRTPSMGQMTISRPTNPMINQQQFTGIGHTTGGRYNPRWRNGTQPNVPQISPPQHNRQMPNQDYTSPNHGYPPSVSPTFANPHQINPNENHTPSPYLTRRRTAQRNVESFQPRNPYNDINSGPPNTVGPDDNFPSTGFEQNGTTAMPPLIQPQPSIEPQSEVERQLQELERQKREAADMQLRQQQKARELEEKIERLRSQNLSGSNNVGCNMGSMNSVQNTIPPSQTASNHELTLSHQPAKKVRMGPPETSDEHMQVDPNRKKEPTASAMQIIESLGSQSSLVYSFNVKEIEEHVKSLYMHSIAMKFSDVKSKALTLWKKLDELELSWIFAKPVDPLQLDIPDYFDVIKRPMDLGTVRKKLDSNRYRDLRSFAEDVRLVFNNALIYNPSTSDVHGIAKKYGAKFEKDYYTLQDEMRDEETQKRRNENACKLCGGCKYIFEPPVYYCNGKCNQKIRRAAYFYSTPDNKQFYCLTCFNGFLKDSVLLEDGSSIPKIHLMKKKNDEVQEESWVECSQCKSWFHQVCALFNGRRNDQSSNNDPYFCPMCVLKHIERLKKPHAPPPSKIAAISLPQTNYSKFLQSKVLERILKERKLKAKIDEVPVCDVKDCGEISIRVVSCKDTLLYPRAGLAALYKDSYPTSFPHRVKCILLFEKRDGVDCLILGMYTQVYGSDCPEPNARSLYIAYLDSVYYFTPEFLRTAVYHEMIISTMEYEKKRGITKAFIWVCPPLAGDDYILYCHPKDQRTPKAEMLRNWYFKLLEQARQRGIVVSLDNLFDGYLQRVPNVGLVPNFEGDYWPGVSEQFIEQLKNEKIDPLSIAPRKKRVYSRSKQVSSSKAQSSKSKLKRSKKKSKPKQKNSKRSSSSPVTTSNVEDDLSQEKSPYMPPKPVPSKELPQQDALTAKIADVIQQMKEDFIVVHMHHICASCTKNIDQPEEVYWLPQDYTPDQFALDYTKNQHAPPYCLCDGCYQNMYEQQFGSKLAGYKPTYDDPDFVKEESDEVTETKVEPPQIVEPANENQPAPVSYNLNTSPIPLTNIEDDFTTELSLPPKLEPMGGEEISPPILEPVEPAEEIPVILPEKQTAKRRSAWTTVPCALDSFKPWKTSIVLDTAKAWEEDPVFDCQFFDTRQQFLFLCQGNKYQFDELRRAKHSSMMVLYHLHNPDLPSFTHSCNGCRVDIATGMRYTCKECEDFDLCGNCHGKVSHQHALHAVQGKGNSIGPRMGPGPSNDMRYPNRGLLDHMALLFHASNCSIPPGQRCSVKNCDRMKQLLRHGNTCKDRASGQCKVCRRVWALLHLHARNCRVADCRVPNCSRLQQHFRQVQMQVQDRRIRMQTQRMEQERTQAQVQSPTPHSPQNVPQKGNHFAMKPSGTHGKYLR